MVCAGAMIVTRMTGGLGNQLFQYAVGRSLALKHDTQLLLDMSAYDDANARAYTLGHFNIKQNFYNAPNKFHKLSNLLIHGNKFYPYQAYINNDLIFDEQVLELPDHSLLIGYWQSEKYFKHIRKELLADLVLTTAMSTTALKRLQEIKNAHAVCVHIRRGDYLSNPSAAKIYFRCDEEYYKNAFLKLNAQVQDLKFFVFSDDIDWAKEHLQFIANAVFIDDPDRSNYEDFELMRHCQHFITANSTYSWWAAWSSEYSGKIIITPAQWFLVDQDPDTGFKLSVKDLIPEAWIKI
jgi:Glycosyl transferase family 11